MYNNRKLLCQVGREFKGLSVDKEPLSLNYSSELPPIKQRVLTKPFL